MPEEKKTPDQLLEERQAKDTLSDIDDMLASMGQGEPSTETDEEPKETEEKVEEKEEVKEEEVVEEKTEEVSEKDKDKGDKGEEEEEKEEEKTEEEEVVEEKEEEVKEEDEPSIDKVREEYEEKMAKLRKAVEDTATEPVPKKPAEDKTTEEVKEPEKRPVGEYIVEETEFDEAIKSKEAMNKLLTRVRDDAIEVVYREITPMVNRTVSHQIGLSNLVNSFYRENPDLAPYKKFVGKVTLRVMTESEAPLSEDKLLENVEKEVRSELGLVKPGTEQETKEKGRTVKRTPTGPKKSGTRRSTPKLTDLEQEFEDIMPEGFDPFTPKK